MARLGFAGISVRQGKRFELDVDGEVTEDRLAEVRRAAETLLANTVIETFDVRFESCQPPSTGTTRPSPLSRPTRYAGGLMGPKIGPRIGVVSFPGSLDDQDALRAIRLCGGEPVRCGTATAPSTMFEP